ncbi:hypothetical protein BRN00_22895 [Xanthomonas oryzae pv. oryzae]|nr:hypothetical protein BRN00_22895 [Xanthomonas oryzae pv. oryzae]
MYQEATDRTDGADRWSCPPRTQARGQGEMAAGSGTPSAERASHPEGCQQAQTPHDLQSAEPYPVGVRAEARGQDLACANEWDP